MTIHWHDADFDWCPCDEPPQLLSHLVQAIDTLVQAGYTQHKSASTAFAMYQNDPATVLEQAKHMVKLREALRATPPGGGLRAMQSGPRIEELP